MGKTLGNIFKGDKVIWMVFFFLCIISIVEVYSASSQLTYKGGNYIAPILKHIGLLAVGVFCMIVTLNIPCRVFKMATPFLLLTSIVSLVYLALFGDMVNGSRRWIDIPLLGLQIQPSEIAKGTLVLATAQILSAMQTDQGADKKAFGYILVVCATIIPFIFIENFSTAALLCAVVFMMMLIGRVPVRQLGALLGVTLIFVVVFFSAAMAFGTDLSTSDRNDTTHVEATITPQKESRGGFFHRLDTWKTRIDKFTSSANNKNQITPADIDLDKDAQVAHANIAIASSNITGKGPGNSEERDFLSQAFSDFIYSIIIEEMGIVGAFFVAMLYIILLFRTGRIASQCENNFPAFLSMGFALLLVTQALFNMCVAVGLVPVTGQPLPLISKGGTSTIINCVYVGAILSVSRSAKRRQDDTVRSSSGQA